MKRGFRKGEIVEVKITADLSIKLVEECRSLGIKSLKAQVIGTHLIYPIVRFSDIWAQKLTDSPYAGANVCSPQQLKRVRSTIRKVKA